MESHKQKGQDTDMQDRTEGTPSVLSVYDASFTPRGNDMNKLWVFLGGMLAGAASLAGAAFLADTLSAGGEPANEGQEEQLALPEGQRSAIK